MLDGIRKSSFSKSMPGHLHLSFSCKRIKQNLERHHWWRMCKKRSNAFFSIWVLFRYLYVPRLKKNDCVVFWFLCHMWPTDSFVSWTHLFVVLLLWTVINTPLFLFWWTLINTFLSIFSVWTTYNAQGFLFFIIFSNFNNRWCSILGNGETCTALYFV